LKDYSFVSKFAFQPQNSNDIEKLQRRPIDKDIFRKMLFCEEIFRFMIFEETLMYNCIDIDLNFFKKDD
jgi:hypothetical protein